MLQTTELVGKFQLGGDGMNFDFSEEQYLLRDQAKRFLDDRSTSTAVRAVLEDETKAYDEELWRGMAELGWVGTTIPEEYGGAGLSGEDLCVIAEELGRTLAPTPFASSVYMVTEALLMAGSELQKQEYLPAIAAGEMIGCLAVAEGIGVTNAASIKMRASDGVVKGTKVPVADGDIADFAIVLANTGSGNQLSLFLVDLNGDGVSRKPVEMIDPTRSHGEITFEGSAAEPLGEPGQGWPITQAIFDRAAILMAFEQVGGAQACLDMATEYAKNRFAFGRAIGSYQAIKHKLADIYVAAELARANAYYGAWALATDAPDLPTAAAAARVAASEAYNMAARENIQTHGGMGFTWEFDCHLYYRRAKLLSLALGGERVWKDRLISHLEARNSMREE
jgi:alkylation response protein AidB-like acyl-CoA dehydrogenase